MGHRRRRRCYDTGRRPLHAPLPTRLLLQARSAHGDYDLLLAPLLLWLRHAAPRRRGALGRPVRVSAPERPEADGVRGPWYHHGRPVNHRFFWLWDLCPRTRALST